MSSSNTTNGHEAIDRDTLLQQFSQTASIEERLEGMSWFLHSGQLRVGLGLPAKAQPDITAEDLTQVSPAKLELMTTLAHCAIRAGWNRDEVRELFMRHRDAASSGHAMSVLGMIGSDSPAATMVLHEEFLSP